MKCELYKVGNEVDHVLLYDVSMQELLMIQKAVRLVETGNNTKPKDRDIAESISKAFRNCVFVEISEDSEKGII